VPLADDIATPERKRWYVRTLFATIADRYDFITVALSYGQDRRWKRRLTELTQPCPDLHVLDLATGTGDIAFALAARGAEVVGLDVTLRMIAIARAKNASPRPVQFVVGDMIALPFPSASFDAVTIGYGLRNVPDLGAAMAEAARVLKAGGRLVSLDFNRPANRAVRALYLFYLTVVGSVLGWLLHRDPDTYRYIAASLRTYPGAAGISDMLESRGFSSVEHQPILGGLMSIHLAIRSTKFEV
jgi:demethylmenaquinone methyltransferase/2-methoxy-6-polyprenyl-1,4-benzoquinol methylase